MSLEEHIRRVAERSARFYGAETPGHFLVHTHVPADTPPVPPLCDFDLDEQLDLWLECNLAAKKPGWRAKEGLDDDGIPSVRPRFGIAEHSAWLGLDVRLQESTCLPVPAIGTPDDLHRLRLDERNKWFRYMRDSYKYLRERQNGSYVLSVRGAMTPMDLANAVRGDELFVDFLLEPDFCHRLLAWLVDAERWYYGHVLSWSDKVENGHVFMGDTWMPSGTIGHLSNDAAMLCSSDVYDEFGFPYERRLAEGYDRIMYHVHNEKMHYVPRLAGLPGLALLEVTDDPKTPAPVADAERILAATASVNLMLHAESDQVRAELDRWRERNVVWNVTCVDRADAEDMVAFIRDRSKPL